MEYLEHNITVIDGICGSGKTTEAIELIKSLTLPVSYGSPLEDKFIYVTPFVMETHRVAGTIPIDIPKEYANDKTYEGYKFSELSEFSEKINKKPRRKGNQLEYRDNRPTNRDFVIPINRGEGVLRAVKDAIYEGQDIAITHATFVNFDEEIISLLRSNDTVSYRLIIDEVPSVLEELKTLQRDEDEKPIFISQDDINTFYGFDVLKKDENDVLSWVETDKLKKLDKYSLFRRFCDEGRLLQYTDRGKKILLKRMLPEIFKSFKSIHLLTYIFDGSICKSYFDLNSITYAVMKKRLPESRFEQAKYWELIEFAKFNNKTVKDFDMFSLSKNWYIKNKPLHSEIKKLTANFFNNNNRDIDINHRLWTVFKLYQPQIEGHGFKDCFLSLTSRATNAYKDVKALAYLVNLSPPTALSNYLAQKKSHVNIDLYATAEMIQWIFRSQIRDGKPIKLLLPSPRMRKLLNNWLEEYKKDYEVKVSQKTDTHNTENTLFGEMKKKRR